MNATTAHPTPGRTCPIDYHYGPAVFCQPTPPELSGLEVLYVVGGLYGNELALDEVLRLFDAERGRKQLVFNGDFHWFDADPATFDRIQQQVLPHVALRGNVETELAHSQPVSDAGCGCAYPDWVDDAVVTRSNRILQRLWTAATPAHRTQLAALPMWLTASVGGMHVGIVHGDAQSLAGWGFAQEHLADAAHRRTVADWFTLAGVDAFACSHTCLPVYQRIPRASGLPPGWVFNNGAAGMPNFQGDPAGLLTRIATTPCPVEAGHVSRAHVVQDGVHIDALAITVPPTDVQQRFLAQWPPGSDAHASYFARIAAGPTYQPEQVVRDQA
jgi:hypothetical protein